jgi:hypothetical protein
MNIRCRLNASKRRHNRVYCLKLKADSSPAFTVREHENYRAVTGGLSILVQKHQLWFGQLETCITFAEIESVPFSFKAEALRP